MEALVAVGLASNILQFVDFAKSIVSDTKKFYEATSGTNDEYQDAEDHAQRLHRLAAQIATPKVPCGDGELKELARRCSGIASKLLDATRDVTGNSHHDWLHSAQRAVKVHFSSSTIKALQSRLDRISQLLTGRLLHTQLKNTAETLSLMADENRRLSSRRDKDIHYLQNQLRRVTELLERGEIQRDTVLSLSGIAETGAQFSAEQRILGRLFFHGMNDRHTNVHAEHKKTLSWIFERNSPTRFVKFLQGESSLYWVSGKPGSGKSTAMKYMFQHSETRRRLQQWANGSRLIVAKYFFWNAGISSLLKSQEGLLRSILYQIFRAAPDLIPHAFPEDWAAHLSGHFIKSPSSAGSISIAQLLAAIQQLCAHLSELDVKICLFVDGLDEYDGRPGDVIEFIESLKSSTNVKACVSSRPWNEFERAFGQNQRNKLYMQDLTRSDIRKYVRDTLENDQTFRELVVSEGEDRSRVLVHDIVNSAEGVFLWVILVVRSLLEGLTNADTFSNLQRRLQLLPTDLDEYFDRLLFSVDDFYSSQAAAMCLVTLNAARPLPLMSYWFMDQESDRYALELQVRPMQERLIDSRLYTMKKRLNACSKGLLETTNINPRSRSTPSHDFFVQKVDFLHRTVRDFLRIPQTQNRLLDRLPQSFNPAIIICRALLAQVKSSSHDKKLLLGDAPMKKFLDDLFIQVGALEDERIQVYTEVELMDDLGSTLQIQAELMGFNIFDHIGSSNHSEDFLSKCLESNLLRYICTALERKPKPSRVELSSLLAVASWGLQNLPQSEVREDGVWDESQQHLIRRLFSVGADPNCPVGRRQRTPWVLLLEIITQMEKIDRERQMILFSVLADYIKHGATLQSTKDDSFGNESAFETLLETKLTEDQFFALLRLDRSNRAKKRLGNGLRQISIFWKFLTKIGRDG